MDTVVVQSEFNEIVERVAGYKAVGRQTVAVQGLGFVGTATAAVVSGVRDPQSQPCYFVLGIDLPNRNGREKAQKINAGLTVINSADPELHRLIHQGARETKNLYATTDERFFSLADVIIVNVPFDVVDLSIEVHSQIRVNEGDFEKALATIGRWMKPDALILIETTVPVGACEKLAFPVLERERHKRGIDSALFLAYSYERVTPGRRYVDSIRRQSRSFAGVDPRSSAKASDFLTSLIELKENPLIELDSLAACEMGKLLENSYRAMNIAFIHEWTLFAEKCGVDLFSIVDSIRVRKGTHDNMRYPGLGVGGYCLPKDMLLAQWSAAHYYQSDIVLRMSFAAACINREMPLHTAGLAKEILDGHLEGKTILICGVSYLAEVGDTRHSPSAVLAAELVRHGAKVIAHDPYVREWPEMPEIVVEGDLVSCLRRSAAVIFSVPHRAYLDIEPKMLIDNLNCSRLIVDAQNIISDEKGRVLKSEGFRLIGSGKGHWRRQGYHLS